MRLRDRREGNSVRDEPPCDRACRDKQETLVSIEYTRELAGWLHARKWIAGDIRLTSAGLTC
jgi:hypothetical protein